MATELRQAIFLLEIFRPSSNLGMPLDAMLLSSKHLENYDPDEIFKELLLMHQEGLIRPLYSDTVSPSPKTPWSSTRAGQIALRKLLAEYKYMSQALITPQKYSVEDVLLAVLVSHKINPHHHITTSWEDITIYLYGLDETTLIEARGQLLAKEYISIPGVGIPYSPNTPYITGKGLQYYKKSVRERLGLAENQSIFDPPLPSSDDARFGKLGLSPELAANLQLRWTEAKNTKDADAPLACIVLLGSILEGVLYHFLKSKITNAMTAVSAPRIKGTSTTKPLDEWMLKDFISVAAEIGIVNKSITKHSHDLKDSRNLIHPRKQVDENIHVDIGLVNISFEVLNSVLDSLVEYKSKNP